MFTCLVSKFSKFIAKYKLYVPTVVRMHTENGEALLFVNKIRFSFGSDDALDRDPAPLLLHFHVV